MAGLVGWMYPPRVRTFEPGQVVTVKGDLRGNIKATVIRDRSGATVRVFFHHGDQAPRNVARERLS